MHFFRSTSFARFTKKMLMYWFAKVVMRKSMLTPNWTSCIYNPIHDFFDTKSGLFELFVQYSYKAHLLTSSEQSFSIAALVGIIRITIKGHCCVWVESKLFLTYFTYTFDTSQNVHCDPTRSGAKENLLPQFPSDWFPDQYCLSVLREICTKMISYLPKDDFFKSSCVSLQKK